MYVPVEQKTLAIACKRFETRDESNALSTCERFARLHGIGEKHQLRKREGVPNQGVLNRRPLEGLDVQTELSQGLEVTIYALALCRNAVLVMI